MSTDPIADLLTKIRNAGMAKKKEVEVPHSKIKEELAVILKKENFVEDFVIEEDLIRVYLKYHQNTFGIIGIKRISKPGLRRYAKSKELGKNRFRTSVVSTSKGLMTDREAKEKKLGGEVICQIW